MDIMDLPRQEAQKLAHHRYHEHLKQLHLLTRERTPIPVYLMESLEQARQVVEMLDEAPGELEQIEMPLDGAA